MLPLQPRLLEGFILGSFQPSPSRVLVKWAVLWIRSWEFASSHFILKLSSALNDHFSNELLDWFGLDLRFI